MLLIANNLESFLLSSDQHSILYVDMKAIFNPVGKSLSIEYNDLEEQEDKVKMKKEVALTINDFIIKHIKKGSNNAVTEYLDALDRSRSIQETYKKEIKLVSDQMVALFNRCRIICWQYAHKYNACAVIDDAHFVCMNALLEDITTSVVAELNDEYLTKQKIEKIPGN